LRALLTDFATGLSRFSLGVVGVIADVAGLPKSKAVPGVLGVLVADPKDAKAPEPSPKAVEAPAVGEAKLPLVRGGMALKGFDLPPCEEVSPPKRFEEE